MAATALMRCPHCGDSHPRDAKACPQTGRPMPGSFLPGQVLDQKYKIVRHIADGGMGAVYEAEHLLIGKRVALKALLPEFSKNGEMLQRFQQEARAASAIGQQNIIDISDMGHAPDGSLFIVMELLRGQNLAERIVALGGRLPIGRAAHVVKQILEALAATHRQGIIHRDLKPENVFLVQRGTDPDFVKVLDFGISKVLTGDVSKLSTTGVVWGTPYYMAPEQARGGGVDHRVDIYACGAMLYQLVTGRMPFTAPNFNALMFEIAGGRYTPVRNIVPDCPRELEQVIQYGMALDPNHRYQSAEHMAQSIAPFAAAIKHNAPIVPEDNRTPSALNAFVPPIMASGGAGPLGTTPAPMRGNVLPAQRRTTSKALPITIGAGIAVGLCLGLVIIKGTGKKKTAAATTTPTTEVTAPAVVDKKPEVVKPPDVMVKPDDKPVEKPGTGTGAEPEAVKAVTIDAGVVVAVVTPDAAVKAAVKVEPVKVEPAVVEATLTVHVGPPDVAAKAVITLDGAPVNGDIKVTADAKKKLRLVVKADGYVPYDHRVVITKDMTVEVVLKKPAAVSNPGGPGGAIDL